MNKEDILHRDDDFRASHNLLNSERHFKLVRKYDYINMTCSDMLNQSKMDNEQNYLKVQRVTQMAK